ncbi:MAG: FecR family protein [bacterium]
MKKLTVAALIAFFFSFFVFATASFCAEEKSGADDCEAYISGVTGTAQYKEKEEDEWTAAELNMCIYVGDTVRTLKDSGLALQFGKKVQMKVNALSTFTVSTMDPKKPSPNQVNLKVGESWSKIDDKNEKVIFAVKTPAALAGVRGTEFAVSVDEEGKSKVSVLEGVVAVLNDLGEVFAEAGKATEILKGAMPGALEDFDVAEFQNKLNEWKDQISVGKIKEAMKGKVEEKKNEIKNNIKGKLKF